ncbi:MAG: NlpC/P60 family protein [Crocinitomicaceae bacterium]|nr:NlpC/P60 family protein [Crocinitomicaceae bacterium]
MSKAYCNVSISPVRLKSEDQSEIVTQLLFGEMVEVQEITIPWAKITVLSDGYEGYIDHKQVTTLSQKEFKRWSEGLSYLKDRQRLLSTPWGNQWICRGANIPEGVNKFVIGNETFQFKDEKENELSSVIEYAEDYINTPYLWGGKSPFGIDCSAIVQVIYRFFGYNLPRDASEQVNHGTEVDFNDVTPGDLAFFENSKKKITHVGILDGLGNIIHASGCVRKDLFTSEGIIHSETGSLTHNLFVIKRM